MPDHIVFTTAARRYHEIPMNAPSLPFYDNASLSRFTFSVYNGQISLFALRDGANVQLIRNRIRDRILLGALLACRDCSAYFNTHLRPNPRMELCAKCFSNYRTCDCGRMYANDSHCWACNFTCTNCEDVCLTTDRPRAVYDLCEVCIFLCTCNQCRTILSTVDRLNQHLDDYHPPYNRVRILSYCHKPSPNFLRDGIENTKRFFGIELEMEFKDHSREGINCLYEGIQANLYYVKGDSSLDEGCELVTHPATKKYWIKQQFLKTEVACLSEYGYKSHDTSTCGLHIHVSRASARMATWAKVALFWYTHDTFIRAICRRDNNSYCKKKKLLINALPRDVTHTYDRYDAVNFSGSKTVEFRQFKGTLNHDTLLNSIRFIDSLLKFCVKYTARDIRPQTAVELFIKEAKNSDVDLFRFIQSRTLEVT